MTLSVATRAQDLDEKLNTNPYALRFCHDYDRGHKPIQEDERSVAGEMPYGYMYVCTSDRACRYAIIRPPAEIAEHWIHQIKSELDGVQKADKKAADQLEAAYQDQSDSVWKCMLDVYCQEKPSGVYENLDGHFATCEKH